MLRRYLGCLLDSSLWHSLSSYDLRLGHLDLRGGNSLVAFEVEHARTAKLPADLLGSLLTDEVELGAADLGALHDFYRVNRGRVEGKDLLDPDARESRAHGKGGARLRTVLHCQHEALEGLLADILQRLLFLVGTATLLELHDVLDDTHGVPGPDSEFCATLYVYGRNYAVRYAWHDRRTVPIRKPKRKSAALKGGLILSSCEGLADARERALEVRR